jgi:hypothetical protein
MRFERERFGTQSMKGMAIIAALAAFTGAALAQHGGHGPASPYAGEQTRAIKSLSQDDIAELRRGGGWGLAKAAELNGVPGPAHLLELKDDIPLNEEQVAAIGGDLYDDEGGRDRGGRASHHAGAGAGRRISSSQRHA